MAMNMAARHEITRDDIMPIDEFAKIRKQRRGEVSAIKRARRVEVGPFATFYFENYDTMWWQIHEMLFIEKGGEAQVEDELRAYNPLIPNGNELVCTFMLEIADAGRRARVLKLLGGIEETVTLDLGGESIAAVPESDVERTTEEGKTSSVHFLHFPFTPAQIAAFRGPGAGAKIAIAHENYGHIAAIPETVRTALAGDFD